MIFKKEIPVITAEEIQQDFFDKSDALLVRARQILSETSLADQQIISMVEDKGFVSNSDVLARYDALVISHYLKKFKKEHFLTWKNTRRLCRKYALWCNGATYFTGHIPEDKQAEIASFKYEWDLCPRGWQGTYVIAPKKMFSEASNNYIDSKGVVHNNDPIVVVPVKRPYESSQDWSIDPFGFIVVSYWGKEGELL
jgi:hypothetical protein